MKRREQQTYVYRRARELAASGKFKGWLDIEFELRYREGLPKARDWLDRRAVRDELDRLCSASLREAQRSDAPGSPILTC